MELKKHRKRISCWEWLLFIVLNSGQPNVFAVTLTRLEFPFLYIRVFKRAVGAIPWSLTRQGRGEEGMRVCLLLSFFGDSSSPSPPLMATRLIHRIKSRVFKPQHSLCSTWKNYVICLKHSSYLKDTQRLLTSHGPLSNAHEHPCRWDHPRGEKGKQWDNQELLAFMHTVEFTHGQLSGFSGYII